MGQVVLHFEKQGKPTGGSLGHHIDRTEGMEYSYQHADLTRTHLNKVYQFNEYCKMKYNEAIHKRIEEGYTSQKSIRRDATYSVNVMLSGSHEEMKAIEADPTKLEEWIKQNANWCIRHFGKENIIRFNVHLDEKTPHIHCTFVPITKDGRLSAKDFIGSSIKLQDLQTSYAKAMEKFGLERGIKSDRKHQTTDEYRRREAQKLTTAEELHKKIDSIGKSNLLFGLENLKKDLKAGINQAILNNAEVYEKREIEQAKFFREVKQSFKEFDRAFELREPLKTKYIANDKVNEIINQSNLIDYFLYLADKGFINFEKKSGKEFLFTNENQTQKISVSEKGWHDLKSGEGGQIIKAIQKYQKLDWLEAVNWLNEFNTGLSTDFTKIREKTALERQNLEDGKFQITQVAKPSTGKLINYFRERGISSQTLREYTKQIHYQVGQNHYYGIGYQNVKGGYEIRNPFAKTKFGTSDVTELGNPQAKKMAVCEGMTDTLSMIEILKAKGRDLNDYKFVCLNSVTNVSKFIERYQNESSQMFFCLDGDSAGNEATKKLLEQFPQAQDVRDSFGIHEQGYKDLNEHLKDILFNREKRQKIETPKPPQKGYGFRR